ncbi:glycosyltransferase family 2 protein [Rhodococcus tukisamuensis]|uniref:Glycosyltransferase, GT2 family n=1 Tax=Rhodococcus tukisamuensis TaxID=168276 RepID=A0A1G7AKF5_9NOCA|nr:glycosyltransferase family 2 protein [Rhodococcus tukisamuensis]SDE15301.1 Glycosyltransferase, GT2 family [Rhodococcus tukisamuensis]
MTEPRIGIVIVTYDSADVLPGCLNSLVQGQRGVELAATVVVDNASVDNSVAVAEASRVTTVRMGRNAGYAAGFNAGVAVLDLDALDAVCVLNPDCRLRPGALAALADAVQRPGYGIAAPRLVNPDGTLQPTLRRMPAVHRAVVEAVVGGSRAGRFGELIKAPEPHATPGPAAWATGAALLMSVEALRTTGEWDESFLLYSEETDFILRAADQGWALWYEPAAVVEHLGAASGFSPALAGLIAVNKIRLFRRRRRLLATIAYALAVTAGEGVRALAGRPCSRAAFIALVRPSQRLTSLAGG